MYGPCGNKRYGASTRLDGQKDFVLLVWRRSLCFVKSFRKMFISNVCIYYSCSLNVDGTNMCTYNKHMYIIHTCIYHMHAHAYTAYKHTIRLCTLIHIHTNRHADIQNCIRNVKKKNINSTPMENSRIRRLKKRKTHKKMYS